MKQLKQKGWWGRKTFKLTVVFAVLLLLLSYLAAYISPKEIWLMELLALSFPFILLLNLVLLLLGILMRHQAAFFIFLALLLGYTTIKATFPLRFTATPEPEKSKTIKIMTFNARLFDLYKWTGSDKTPDKIYELIKKENPDILCIQEFYTAAEANKNHVEKLKKLLNFKAAQFESFSKQNQSEHAGMAIFSKFRATDRGKISFNEKTNNNCIYADLLLTNDTIRIYNTHFQSNRFDYADHDFLANQGNNHDKIAASKNILWRLKTAAQKRAVQVEKVKTHAKQSPYPVIICGDFNDTPASYTYKTISEGLKDSFTESGTGWGNTYTSFRFLPLRIDYILHHPDFNSYNTRVIKQKLSDHYPVVTEIEIPR